jgi:SAM-dependent methyltransferase
MNNRPADVWASGEAYERYIGRWSRLGARELLRWLNVSPHGRWLDVGCGTGALGKAILEIADPAEILGIDAAEGFVQFARSRHIDARVRFEIGDARSLPVETGSFDVAVSALTLNFVPEPERAVTEMARAVRAGGAVAAYVWDYAGKMQLLRRFWDAAIALDPAAAELDEGRRFPMCRPEALEALFQSAGLGDVQVRPIDVATDFANLTISGRRSLVARVQRRDMSPG